MLLPIFTLLPSFLLFTLTSAHALITHAHLPLGSPTSALGYLPDSSRSLYNDVSVFTANLTGCGTTQRLGLLNTTSLLTTFLKSKPLFPQFSSLAGGAELNMTLKQVTDDGAGPFQCYLDTTATGEEFVEIPVLVDVPGKKGVSQEGAAMDWPLVAMIPEGTKCTGPQGLCLVRCQNTAAGGPFGSCIPIQQVTEKSSGAA